MEKGPANIRPEIVEMITGAAATPAAPPPKEKA
jgi:hypothetical protein